MRHIGSRDNYNEFLCDICGRHLLLHSSPSTPEEREKSIVILKQGDFWASHSGGFGGLVINGVEVQKDHGLDQDADEVELSDEWKGWLADILDDAE